MARLLTNGAELNSSAAADGPGIEYYGTAYTGDIRTVTTPAQGSRYAWKLTASATKAAYFRNYFVFGGGTTASNLYGKFDWQTDTATPSSKLFLWQLASNTAKRAAIMLNTDGTLQIYTGGGVAVGSKSSAISANTWYQIEWFYDQSGTDATLTLKVNGTTVSTGTVQLAASGLVVNNQYVGQFDLIASNFYYDNIIVNDTSGTNENSWVGGQKVLFFSPIGQGLAPDGTTYVNWKLQNGSAGGANNYTYVDEKPPSATDYVKRVNTSPPIYKDWYIPETIATTGNIAAWDPITVVAVSAYGSSGGTTARTVSYFFNTTTANDTAQQTSSAQDWASTADFMNNINDTVAQSQFVIYNPGTGGDIANWMFGAASLDGTSREVRLEGIWMEVSYIDANRSYGTIY